MGIMAVVMIVQFVRRAKKELRNGDIVLAQRNEEKRTKENKCTTYLRQQSSAVHSTPHSR
jgi:hypothetical protein